MNETQAKITYWSSPSDSRKTALMIIKKLWIIAAGAVLGAVCGLIVYYVFHAVTDTIMYSAVSEFYLDFAYDETGEVYDYYNGYTWNDLMTTDPIAAHTLDYVKKGVEVTSDGDGSVVKDASANGYSGSKEVNVSVLEADTTAEILSDIRVLRITIRDNDEALCRALSTASQGALVTFGNEAKEFTKITLIKSSGPVREYADDRTLQAVILGLIIGTAAALIVLWFVCILDDRIMFPPDLYDIRDSFAGSYDGQLPEIRVELKTPDEKLASRINFGGGIKTGAAEADVHTGSGLSDEGPGVAHIDAGAFSDPGAQLPELLSGTVNAVIDIPYCRVRKSALILLVDRLISCGVKIEGFMITQADNSAYVKYYFLSGRNISDRT